MSDDTDLPPLLGKYQRAGGATSGLNNMAMLKGISREVLSGLQRRFVEALQGLLHASLNNADALRFSIADLTIERPLRLLDAEAVFGAASAPQRPLAAASIATLTDLAQDPGARIWIEGDLGIGKSVCLHRIALACAANAVDGGAQMEGSIAAWPGRAPLPLFISVGSGMGAGAKSRYLPPPFAFSPELEELLHRHGKRIYRPLLRLLQAGDCLVLIDGLDVADDAAAAAAISELDRFVARYPYNHYVVACRTRPAGTPIPLSGFVGYALDPLDDAQIDDLIVRWYTALAGRDDAITADELRERIAVLQGLLRADTRLRALAGNPLALALCVIVHAEGHPLPDARALVLRRLLDLLLGDWERIRTDGHAPTLAQALDMAALHASNARLALLQPLALAFQPLEKQVALDRAHVEALLGEGLAALGAEAAPARERALPDLTAWLLRQGLLAQARLSASYTMPHDAIRSYLSARAIAALPDFAARAYALRHNPRWREALLLAIYEQGGGPAAHAVHELLRWLVDSSGPQGDEGRPDVDRPPPGSPAAPWRDLLLAAEGMADLGKNAPPDTDLRARLSKRLLGLLGARKAPVVERIQAGLLLGRLGDPRFAEVYPQTVHVAAGAYVRGTLAGYDDERPVQRVNVRVFEMGTYLVTNQEYARFLADVPSQPRPHYWHNPQFNNPSQPVVGVTWHDATAYCAWLTEKLTAAGLLGLGMVVRLPLEDEWEKAASWDPQQRAKRRYPWGDAWSSERANTAEARGAWTTTPVGCYPDGVSAYGLYDMVGNVWEWTVSEYASYPGTSTPFRDEGSYTLRGSSFSTLPTHARCTFRSRLPAGYWRYHLGFRIVIGQPLGALVEGQARRRARPAPTR